MPVSEEVPLTAFTLELKHALSAVGECSQLGITANQPCWSLQSGMASYCHLSMLWYGVAVPRDGHRAGEEVLESILWPSSAL